MKILRLALLMSLMAAPVVAAESGKDLDPDLAVKSSRVETLRARAAMTPTATTSTTLIEAENLLQQLRQAPPAKRGPLRAQLDAALTRLELEIDSASRNRP